MTTTPRSRPLAFLAALSTIAIGLWAASGFPPASAQAEDSSSVLVARSICEAHELRARAAKDSHLKIEIPKEFAGTLPTREACLSHAAAEDPNTPGPVQPIQFSHKHHAGMYEIDCQYCHTGTDVSPIAGVPSVELCMGCHSQFGASYDELEGIRTLKDHWERKVPVEWVQIHRVPEHVQFQHRAHINAGFECQTCHGPVEDMDKIYMIEDTRWWPWLLPTKTLEMGWCIDCHRDNGATQDCIACHY